MENFNSQQKFLSDSLKYNTLESDLIFTRRKFRFDTSKDFNDIDLNEFKTAFKGFWVVDSSDSSFLAEMKVNYRQNIGDSLPLRKNMTFDFDEMMDGAKLKWPSQSGKWVEIIFFHKGNSSVGNVEISVSGRTSNITGTQYSNGSFEVDTTSKEILAVNQNRTRATIINKSGADIYLGTDLKISDASFETECIPLGDGENLEWTNTNSLFARVATGTANVIILEEE